VACVMLGVFTFEVEAEFPFGIGPGKAAALIADATRIRRCWAAAEACSNPRPARAPAGR
jgi:hypothetical protein